MPLQTFEAYKDPDAVIDFSFDWTHWIDDGDTIATSTWTPETGIDVDSDSETTLITTITTVWLSGGTAGEVYEVVNRIVTSEGRTDDRTLNVHVFER